jgi:hypothetical protein
MLRPHLLTVKPIPRPCEASVVDIAASPLAGRAWRMHHVALKISFSLIDGDFTPAS